MPKADGFVGPAFNHLVGAKTGIPKWVALGETWTQTCGLPFLLHFEPHPSDYLTVVVKTSGIPFWLVEFTAHRTYFSGWIGMGLSDLEEALDPKRSEH